MLAFDQLHKEVKYIFVLDEDKLEVCKYYNGHGLRYTHKVTKNDTIAELARLVERFKMMPNEMWEAIEPERIKSH